MCASCPRIQPHTLACCARAPCCARRPLKDILERERAARESEGKPPAAPTIAYNEFKYVGLLGEVRRPTVFRRPALVLSPPASRRPALRHILRVCATPAPTCALVRVVSAWPLCLLSCGCRQYARVSCARAVWLSSAQGSFGSVQLVQHKESKECYALKCLSKGQLINDQQVCAPAERRPACFHRIP